MQVGRVLEVFGPFDFVGKLAEAVKPLRHFRKGDFGLGQIVLVDLLLRVLALRPVLPEIEILAARVFEHAVQAHVDLAVRTRAFVEFVLAEIAKVTGLFER